VNGLGNLIGHGVRFDVRDAGVAAVREFRTLRKLFPHLLLLKANAQRTGGPRNRPRNWPEVRDQHVRVLANQDFKRQFCVNLNLIVAAGTKEDKKIRI
jgi:hypothetical protein